jgi:hypothetical protein
MNKPITPERAGLLVALLLAFPTASLLSAETDTSVQLLNAREELHAERHQLRDELQALRARFTDHDDAFAEALDLWRARREERLAEWRARWASIAEPDATASVPPPPPRQLPPDADEATVLRFQLRDEMRSVRNVHAHLPVEERHEAFAAWREANEHRFQEVRRLMLERDAAERTAMPPMERDYSRLPEPHRKYAKARDAMRSERLALAARFGPGQEEERHAALLDWWEGNRRKLNALRQEMQHALSEEEQR